MQQSSKHGPVIDDELKDDRRGPGTGNRHKDRPADDLAEADIVEDDRTGAAQ